MSSQIELGKLVLRFHGKDVSDFGQVLQDKEDSICHHLDSARAAAENAYAPYSNFRVGASVLAADGELSRQFTGCNVENASYGAAMCAERVAIFSAVSEKFQNFEMLVLSTLDSAHEAELSRRSPCGFCRQVMSEFFDDDTMILVDGGTDKQDRDRVDFLTIAEVLPWRFDL